MSLVKDQDKNDKTKILSALKMKIVCLSINSETNTVVWMLLMILKRNWILIINEFFLKLQCHFISSKHWGYTWRLYLYIIFLNLSLLLVCISNHKISFMQKWVKSFDKVKCIEISLTKKYMYFKELPYKHMCFQFVFV